MHSSHLAKPLATCPLQPRGGFNWSGVDPPLSSSRACLTAFIANSVP